MTARQGSICASTKAARSATSSDKLGGKTHVPNLFNDGARKIGLAKARAKSIAWDAIIREGRDPAAEERRKVEAHRRLPSVAVFPREYIERGGSRHGMIYR
jgi:hypothetical protein